MNNYLIYDVAAMPHELTSESLYQLISYFDIILYDSRLGNAPKYINEAGETVEQGLILDLSNKEMKLKAEEISGYKFKDIEDEE